MRARAVAALALVPALLAAPHSSRAAEPLKLRIGWVVVPGHLFPVLFQ